MFNKRAIVKIVFLFTMLAFLVPIAQATVEDDNAYAIAKQNACLGCHAINKKIVGPSFQSVAEKYKNTPGAQAFLKNKIAKGGSGSWGVVPMPANTKLSDADLSALTGWVLRGAPSKN
ncbi:cytochrome c, class I [Polynucleobacter sp. JS-Safj-400b-B2]|jgi:cytochrome c|uniref:c-type cytochrome n=1 Tax=Polynucleobacter sp. JS-Safj-400b-B2 TaxID=2576921 RepID=UPI001C0E3F75|nr:c-type cytochrome [Polynucleobacter sp. JS-Safj-400b-B2]MBU3625336.1 cytochrome c, class I [Polynucleobacter sp. JS-Safj-400b-B2]